MPIADIAVFIRSLAQPMAITHFGMGGWCTRTVGSSGLKLKAKLGYISPAAIRRAKSFIDLAVGDGWIYSCQGLPLRDQASPTIQANTVTGIFIPFPDDADEVFQCSYTAIPVEGHLGKLPPPSSLPPRWRQPDPPATASSGTNQDRDRVAAITGCFIFGLELWNFGSRTLV